MLFNDLEIVRNSMDKLHQKQLRIKNKEVQKQTDERFNTLAVQFYQFVCALKYAYEDLGIPKNTEILNNSLEGVRRLDSCLVKGNVTAEDINPIYTRFTQLNAQMKSDWKAGYKSVAEDTVSTLYAIQGIEPDKVSACLDKIKAAQEWSASINVLNKLSEGLKEAIEIIHRLEVDDEIIVFLQKSNSGKATLEDLSDKVLNWLRREGIERKIKISFAKN